MAEFWKQLGAWGGIFSGIQFAIITLGIMLFYPEGYDFLNNTFSSLGLTVTNGYATPINHALFAIAGTVAAGASVPFWLSIRTVFTESTPQKVISWIGTILGLAAAPFLASLTIFAGDVFPLEHGLSTILFFILFALAIGVYSFGILLNKEYDNKFALVGFVVAILDIVYIFFIGTAWMQKVAVYGMILYSVFQGYRLRQVFAE
ncbi:MAG: hypothetical protein E3J86_06360 [Candidatus Thorarchaeota archaeon]|nr:MAG: hypothetical protein E3J86_06360 [Candidatus Thorarchaeota archaeon]